MSEVKALVSDQSENLKPRLKAVYELWKLGHDIKSMYPSKTYYRYRNEIKKEIGIDIAVLQPSQKDDSMKNVVPFVRIIEAKPMGIPDWAYGTNLYYEPPALKAVL